MTYRSDNLLPPISITALFMGKYRVQAYENHFSFLSVWLENSVCSYARADVNSALLTGNSWSRGQQ